MDLSYAEVGTEVVVAFHRSEQYIWYPQSFVCRKATITHRDLHNKMCRVRGDHDGYWWPVRDMILVSDIDLLTPEQRVRIK
jgi:hypothetical protein